MLKSEPARPAVRVQDARELRNLIHRVRMHARPVDWLYSVISDAPLEAEEMRELAQRLDRHADAMERG